MEIFKWNLMLFIKKNTIYVQNECVERNRERISTFQNDLTNDHCGGTQSSISSSYQA